MLPQRLLEPAHPLVLLCGLQIELGSTDDTTQCPVYLHSWQSAFSHTTSGGATTGTLCGRVVEIEHAGVISRIFATKHWFFISNTLAVTFSVACERQVTNLAFEVVCDGLLPRDIFNVIWQYNLDPQIGKLISDGTPEYLFRLDFLRQTWSVNLKPFRGFSYTPLDIAAAFLHGRLEISAEIVDPDGVRHRTTEINRCELARATFQLPAPTLDALLIDGEWLPIGMITRVGFHMSPYWHTTTTHINTWPNAIEGGNCVTSALTLSYRDKGINAEEGDLKRLFLLSSLRTGEVMCRILTPEVVAKLYWHFNLLS